MRVKVQLLGLLGPQFLDLYQGMLGSQPPSTEGCQKDDVPGAQTVVSCH